MTKIKFFLQIFKIYKWRIVLLLIYTICASYCTPYLSILIHKTDLVSHILLAIICAIQITLKYIHSIFLFPIYNKANYLLKLHLNETIKKKDISAVFAGKIISRFQRASIKLILKNSINVIANIISLFSSLLLIQATWIFYITIICFMGLFIKILHIGKYYRNLAWKKTELASHICKETFDQIISVQQNFFDKKHWNIGLQKEFFAWNNYYFNLNIYNILISLTIILIFCTSFYKTNNTLLIWTFCLNLNSLKDNMLSFYMEWIDIQVFFEETHASKCKTIEKDHIEINSLFLEMNNKRTGPFNFASSKKIIVLVGKNGIGKTRLSLALANLIPYEGIICTPKALYLNMETKLINTKTHYSKGEMVLKILEQALKFEAQLLIIDEVLDFLDEKNLSIILAKLVESQKQLFIISHKDSIVQAAQQVIKLERNNIKIIR